MKNNFELELKDYRDSFNEPHKKKPYYLYVGSGNRNFYFSNKFKAERWLTKFKKSSSELYRELNYMLFDLFKLSATLIEITDYATVMRLQKSIQWHYDHYHKIYVNLVRGVEVGRELKNVYHELIKQLNYYKSRLVKSTRFRYLHEKVNQDIRKAKRLYKEFDLLLSGADGIKQITNSDLKKHTFVKTLNIAV